MTHPADYLSDEDCRRMLVAFYTYDVAGDSEFTADEMESIRRAWSSRPESARKADEAAMRIATEFDDDPYIMDGPISSRGRELLKASGGNSDEPSDNKSPTGGAAGWS